MHGEEDTMLNHARVYKIDRWIPEGNLGYPVPYARVYKMFK